MTIFIQSRYLQLGRSTGTRQNDPADAEECNLDRYEVQLAVRLMRAVAIHEAEATLLRSATAGPGRNRPFEWTVKRLGALGDEWEAVSPNLFSARESNTKAEDGRYRRPQPPCSSCRITNRHAWPARRRGCSLVTLHRLVRSLQRNIFSDTCRCGVHCAASHDVSASTTRIDLPMSDKAVSDKREAPGMRSPWVTAILTVLPSLTSQICSGQYNPSRPSPTAAGRSIRIEALHTLSL